MLVLESICSGFHSKKGGSDLIPPKCKTVNNFSASATNLESESLKLPGRSHVLCFVEPRNGKSHGRRCRRTWETQLFLLNVPLKGRFSLSWRWKWFFDVATVRFAMLWGAKPLKIMFAHFGKLQLSAGFAQLKSIRDATISHWVLIHFMWILASTPHPCVRKTMHYAECAERIMSTRLDLVADGNVEDPWSRFELMIDRVNLTETSPKYNCSWGHKASLQVFPWWTWLGGGLLGFPTPRVARGTILNVPAVLQTKRPVFELVPYDIFWPKIGRGWTTPSNLRLVTGGSVHGNREAGAKKVGKSCPVSSRVSRRTKAAWSENVVVIGSFQKIEKKVPTASADRNWQGLVWTFANFPLLGTSGGQVKLHLLSLSDAPQIFNLSTWVFWLGSTLYWFSMFITS